jgi:hypothetical protein
MKRISNESQDVSIDHKEELYNEFLKTTTEKGPGDEWNNFVSSEALYTLGNKSFTGLELRRVILISEKNSAFNVTGFIRAFVFHMIFFFLGPVFGNILLLTISCCNKKLIFNYSFCTANMFFMLQTMTWLGVSSSLIFYGRMYNESLEDESEVYFNWLDLAHFFIMIAVRLVVISVKYGYYSNEHDKILNNIYTDDNLVTFDLLAATANDKSSYNLYERLGLITEFLQTNKGQFFFMVEKESMKGFERLTSKENLI